MSSARALGLAMLGEKLPAETAERWGMIWKCVDDAALDTEVDALAARLADPALYTKSRAEIEAAQAQHHARAQELAAALARWEELEALR